MSTPIEEKAAGYRIGAPARLTGLSGDNPRICERRYRAVAPARTDSGDRYYSMKAAALHAYLNEIASRARCFIENALSKMIEVDNIELCPAQS